MSTIKCSFFGHRYVIMTDEQYEELRRVIEDLIVNKNVRIFLFGSKSQFNDMCHKMVTELKGKYPYIVRKCYTCRSEKFILESEREYWENLYSNVIKKSVSLLGFEEEVEYKAKYTSAKASYVERNQAMIDDSDYCVFYYDKNYQPKMRKYSKDSLGYYQPNSGTAVAYSYAKQKRKTIINIVNL